MNFYHTAGMMNLIDALSNKVNFVMTLKVHVTVLLIIVIKKKRISSTTACLHGYNVCMYKIKLHQ